MDKLTVGHLEEFITYGNTPDIPLCRGFSNASDFEKFTEVCARQLLDTMRENERLAE